MHAVLLEEEIMSSVLLRECSSKILAVWLVNDAHISAMINSKR